MTDQGREMHHFLVLDRNEQAAAIARLAASGASEYVIAAATRLSVEQISIILGKHRAMVEQVA